MPSISEIRHKYPQYKDMSDEELASALHKRFYSDLDYTKFRQRIGLPSNLGRDPNTGNYDVDLATIDALISGKSDGRPASATRAPLTLPMGAGQFTVGGDLAHATRALSSVRDETSFPLVGATLASVAFPPAAVGGLLARFGPTVLGTGVGGGLGGAAAESSNPDATAGSIARAGLKDAALMATAEALGLGLGGVANKIMAPNMRLLDPLKASRNRLREPLQRSLQRVKQVLPQSIMERPTAKLLMSKIGRFAASEMANAAAVPVATAAFGPQVGVLTWLAKQLLSPSPAARYLSRSTLPPLAVRQASRQAATVGMRGLLEQEDE